MTDKDPAHFRGLAGSLRGVAQDADDAETIRMAAEYLDWAAARLEAVRIGVVGSAKKIG